MTPEHFKKIQKRLRMTNLEMARWLGVCISTIQKYRSGARPVSTRSTDWIKYKLEERARELEKFRQRYREQRDIDA